MINTPKFYKKLVLITILLFIIITVLFLWKEIPDLSIDKKINSDKLSAYFTSIGAIGTTLALLLLFWQIKLMEDANRLPIKPEIFIETKQFELYEEESFGLPIVMVKLLFNDVKDDNYPFPFLNAINVGNGVAKKIVMTWEYNSKEVEHAAKSIYNLEAFQNEKNEIRFDFLKPNDHLYLSPPKGYLPCCGSKLNPSLTEAWLYPESYKKPRLLLHVDYSDISGYSNYKRTFEVQVKAITSTVTFRFLLQNEYD